MLGVQPPILEAVRFLMSAPHYGCVTKTNPTAWTPLRCDHTGATPSPSATSGVLWGCRRPQLLWDHGCGQVGELCSQGSRVKAATTEACQWAGGRGLGGRVWQVGMAIVPAACSSGRTFLAGEFKLGYSHCRSLNIIFIFQSHFFCHLSPLWRWHSCRKGG